MAARHDIIHIDFQANAGKANAALQALQTEAAKARDKVTQLRNDLQNAKATNMPVDQIQKLEAELKKAETESRQWSQALQNNMKGVRALDEAIKQFNNGKGSVEGMSAALSKAARNAAQLQQSRETRGSQTWKEMEALIIALDKNIAKANIDIANLVSTVQNGGKTTKAALTQAKTDLEQLMTMTVRGSKEWNGYNKQLKVVAGELNKIAEAEKKAAKADQTAMMTKRMKELSTMSATSLGEMKRFWEQAIAGAEKGSAAMAKYEANLKRVKTEEQKRTAASAGQVLGNMSMYGIDQIRKAVQDMTLLRDSMKEGSKEWAKYNSMVQQGSAYLKEYDEREKIARGDAMSLADALKLSANAGGKGFSGTAQQLKQAEEALQKAAAAAKKGSPEWQRYQEALAKVRVEMQNAGMTSERMQEILAKPANAKNLQELAAAVKRSKMELDLMAESVGKDSIAYMQLADATKKAEIQLKSLQAQSKGTATAFDKAWSRLKTYIGLYMGAAVAMQKLVGVMSDITELSDKMGEVRKTTGFTADEVGRLSNNLKKMDVRTSLVELMEVSAAAGQLGLKTLEDVQGFTEAANKLMIALPEMGKEAATEMMRVAIATGEVDKIRKQMQEGLIDGSSATAVAMEKIASTIDRLRATSASTAPEITDFVKRVGAVGAQSGITIDQVSALGSTISSLGMRVEMSATALSRMIPAIKNNAFDIARAIGVTPNTIRELFDAGRGMEAILMILQHMKDAGMDEDSIEAMMGMGGMRDIMKDLNQQGARAGIVFAGLSQNVDELRRQLGVANQAYEENIAIQQEFDKMNQTTAARWERLKNQIEEMFVGDKAQRFLGNIIDGLRVIVDFISSNGPIATGLKYIILLWSAFKLGVGQGLLVNLPKALGALTASLGRFFSVALIGLGNMATKLGVVTASTRLARMEWKKLDLAMKQNIFGMIAAAILYATHKLIEWRQKAAEARKEIGEMAHEMVKAEEGVKKNFKAVEQTNAAIAIAKTKLYQARKELDAAKKAMDGSKESADRLANAEKNLKEKEDQLRIAQDKRRSAIETINKLYGSYLGFLLSETAQYGELKNAIELVNNKLREGIILRRKEAAVSKVEGEEAEGRDVAYGALSEQVRGLYLTKQKVNGKETFVSNTEANEKLLKNLTRLAQDEKFAVLTYTEQQKKIRELLKGTGYENGGKISETVIGRTINYAKKYQEVQKKVNNVASQYDVMAEGYRAESKEGLSRQFDEARKTWSSLQGKYIKATGEDKKKAAAELLKQDDELKSIIAAAPNYYNLNNEQEKTDYDNLVKDMEKRRKSIADKRESLIKEAGSYYTQKTGGGGGGTNPWGSKQPAESTNYRDMNAEELVNRRKQMKDFVNAIKTDSDVKSVLAEDKALKKAIENGMSSDMRTVIGWYNTERLKIQDELHGRFLTNTGDWMDPKKQKARHKQFKAEMQAYLEELDAYYTERNQEIQNARNNEEITEGEAWRQTIENEREWHHRRAELQKMYSEKSIEVTREEQDFIHSIIAERTGDDVKYIEKSIEKTKQFAEMVRKADSRGEAEFRKWQADLGLGWEKDFLAAAKSVGKQVKFMADTLAKERPLNGITEDLELNLTKMGILVGNVPDKMHFLLGQIKDAFSLDAKELTDRIIKEGKEGFQEWADMIRGDVSVQQALLAQLRDAYEKVQDAIRKEGARIKKDADMMWKLALTPDGKNLKKETDDALSRLGLLQDSVSRANSLIGAGSASDNIASKLAIKQLQLQLSIQSAQFALMRKMGEEKARYLDQLADEYKANNKIKEAERARMDADNVRKSLELAITEEKKKQADLTNQIAKEQEEAQNRLYKDLREWGELLSSSARSLMEASNAGNAEYYNERAKLNLTGKGGPGAGTYIIIDDAGTEDAKAHYEYLDERQALERQHQIEQENAQAEAWKKVWDDINQKMNDTITDQLNAMLQNQSIDLNTQQLGLNTNAVGKLTEAVGGLTDAVGVNTRETASAKNMPEKGKIGETASETPGNGYYPESQVTQTTTGESSTSILFDQSNVIYGWEQMAESAELSADRQVASIDKVKMALDSQFHKQKQESKDVNNQMASSTQSTFAKMIQAANLYGVAYQAMSNENLSAEQKFQMIALQAAGNAAIAGLTASSTAATATVAAQQGAVASRTFLELGPIAGPIALGALTALIGGLIGMAVSKVAKAKSEISQVTGASLGAGRLATGMLTYGEGNVNEFTDPASLTPGRHYNVDGADGNTYRAKYMGKDAKTHITNGPEFHLVGEKGREAIIDAHTTRLMQMDDTGIWQSIQTLYNGGSLRHASRRSLRRGIPAFADGNIGDFEDMGGDGAMDTGGMSFGAEQLAAFQGSLDRNNELLDRALKYGIKGVFNVYGHDGLVASYDKGKNTLQRHGEKS